MQSELVAAAQREWSDRRLAGTVFLVLFPLMLATASWSLPYHIDPLTNVYTASTIARTGSPILEDYEALATPEAYRVLAWVVESPRGPVSQYPPGTALFAAPVYLFAGGGEVQEMAGSNDPDLEPVRVRVPPLWPAAIAAALAAAGAAAALGVAVHGLVGSRWALVSALVTAAGTGLWLNGSHELWQHGVTSLWIAVGLVAAARAAWLPAGLALGLGVLTRPTLAIVAAGLGLYAGVRDRTWRPTLLVGIGAAAGLVALLAYNYWVWDELTVSGGYSAAFVERLDDPDAGWYLRNLGGALLSVDRGLVVWSPFLVVAALGLPRVWRALPTWAVASFLGGVLLFLVQFRLNRYSGGYGFFSYRYGVEPVVAAMPALAVAARAQWLRGGLWQRVLLYTTAWSLALHGAAVAVKTGV